MELKVVLLDSVDRAPDSHSGAQAVNKLSSPPSKEDKFQRPAGGSRMCMSAQVVVSGLRAG
jgi:hypothetical protein